MTIDNIILASSSPRRIQLLKDMGFTFITVSPNIDETRYYTEKASDYSLRLARAKAQAVGLNYSSALIISADTIVVVGDVILGKPRDFGQFEKMMKLLSNKTHLVMTAVVVLFNSSEYNFCVETEVSMRPITDDEIVRYWNTNEPKDKAGGYAIQGIGGQFIKSISGSYSNVVGLPQAELYELLNNLGVVHEGIIS